MTDTDIPDPYSIAREVAGEFVGLRVPDGIADAMIETLTLSRTNPEHKAASAMMLEHLNADLAVVMASIDEMNERRELGDNKVATEVMIMFTRYVGRLESKRATALVFRLGSLLLEELADKWGGRQVVIDRLGAGEQVFARDREEE